MSATPVVTPQFAPYSKWFAAEVTVTVPSMVTVWSTGPVVPSPGVSVTV
jgi:hypothetical protein